MNSWTVTLKPESPYYDVFRNGIVPVQTSCASLLVCGEAKEAVYFVDFSRMDSDVVEDLFGRVAELLGGRVTDIRDEVFERGLPVRFCQIAEHPLPDIVISIAGPPDPKRPASEEREEAVPSE